MTPQLILPASMASPTKQNVMHVAKRHQSRAGTCSPQLLNSSLQVPVAMVPSAVSPARGGRHTGSSGWSHMPITLARGQAKKGTVQQHTVQQCGDGPM